MLMGYPVTPSPNRASASCWCSPVVCCTPCTEKRSLRPHQGQALGFSLVWAAPQLRGHAGRSGPGCLGHLPTFIRVASNRLSPSWLLIVVPWGAADPGKGPPEPSTVLEVTAMHPAQRPGSCP